MPDRRFPNLTKITCRARLPYVELCQHDLPFTASSEYDGLADYVTDGTFSTVDNSVICTQCYAELLPFTESQQALSHELERGVDRYRSAAVYISNATEEVIRREMKTQTDRCDRADLGSPAWAAADALCRMAAAELLVRERRERTRTASGSDPCDSCGQTPRGDARDDCSQCPDRTPVEQQRREAFDANDEDAFGTPLGASDYLGRPIDPDMARDLNDDHPF